MNQQAAIAPFSNSSDAHEPRRAAGADAEARFVFSLARLAPAGGRGNAADGLSDWRRLLQLAADENALIALREDVRHGGARAVPAEVERQLAILSLDREFRMRCLEQRLEQLLIVLNRAGIDVLLLKGAGLAATVYQSFTARPMRDIDILVRPERADDARALMLKSGWDADPELPGDRTYSTHHHLPPLRDTTERGLRLEIHRSVLPAGHPFRFTDDEIWREARPARIGAGHALVMHPAHHAVHIAIHFAWSHMVKLGAWNAFRDLDALVSGHLLEWKEFTTIALRWRAASSCFWTLRLAQAMSDFRPPEELRVLRPWLPEVICRPLTRHFVNGVTRSGPECPSARLDRALWSLAMQPRRDGHGAVRPWLVSLDLLFTLNEKARETDLAISESPLLQMRRSSRYISEMFA